MNPSVTAAPCQLPLAREPFCARYRSMVRCRAFSCFQSTAWERSAPKFRKSKTGAAAKTYHPSRSEGSIPVGSTRGILKGGTIRAGASCSPLEPASLLTFLPEQESKAAGGQCPLTISHGGFLRIVTSLTRPVSLPRCSRCKDQSPPCQRGVVWRSQTGGILQGGRFPHGSVVIGSAHCESLSHAYGVPAPFRKGAFFIRYRSMVRCRAFSCFQSTAREESTPKSHQPKRG